MKIHEYQGKAVLAQYGVPVPKGKVAYTVDEAVEAGKGLGFPVVVKAQIHAGGRGKGGGVQAREDASTTASRSRRASSACGCARTRPAPRAGWCGGC